MKKVKVLIVDDSAFIRTSLKKALSGSSGIEVVGTASDPYFAVNKIKSFNPDVITLDIEMPRMDGLTFLSKLMISHPMPVIMISSLTDKGTKDTIKALQLGASDFILKPQFNDKNQSLKTFSSELIEKIIAAGNSKITKNHVKYRSINEDDQDIFSDAEMPVKKAQIRKAISKFVIAIGASTGGTYVITRILNELSDDVPGIVIAVHMPEGFIKPFADSINFKSRLYVKEAEHGDRLYNGVALIAPGNRHLQLRHDADGYWSEVNKELPVNRFRPSVDVLFSSVAQIAGDNSSGIILTGMGDDGVRGLSEMKQTGAVTIAQDEESSAVFGMPRVAVLSGAADRVKSIDGIISFINNLR